MSNYQLGIDDASGTITTGGTAQTILKDGAGCRQFLLIQNNATETLWYNFGKTAVAGQPSLSIPAGAYQMWSLPGIVPQQFVSIIGATTGDAFTCKYA